ncbi:MAG: diacylglycerol kinase family protein [Chloroflexota bacterium]
MLTKLIVNPQSHQGRAGKLLPEITYWLSELAVTVDVEQTQAPGHAVSLAQQAVHQGFERIVAVGGDGTCHEVANGLLLATQDENVASLGVIPVGSGNDFAYALGLPTDIKAACTILKQGSIRIIDAGRVIVDGKPHFFVNGVGLGLDAEVNIYASTVKVLQGAARYFWGALRIIAVGEWPYPAQITLDTPQPEQLITLLTVSNGVRAGGGFYLTPNAQLDDGFLDVCYATRVSKLGAFTLFPKTMKGTHLDHPAVTMMRTDKVIVRATTGIPGHIDGEILCVKGHHFEFEILPRILKIWS